MRAVLQGEHEADDETGTLYSLPQHPSDPLFAGRLGNTLQKHHSEHMLEKILMCSNPKPTSYACSAQSPEDRKEEHKEIWWQGSRGFSTVQDDSDVRWEEDPSLESVTCHGNSNTCLGQLVTIWTSIPSLKQVGFRVNAHWTVHLSNYLLCPPASLTASIPLPS